MATPWSDPRTGRFYLRRQIPLNLRPAFGGRAVFKKSLLTKDAGEARAAFARENAVFERLLAEARDPSNLTVVPNDPVTLVKRWLDGPAVNGGLGGRDRLHLVLMQLDTMFVEWLDESSGAENPAAPIETDWIAVARDPLAFQQILIACYQDDVSKVGANWEAIRMDDDLGNLARQFVEALIPSVVDFDNAAVDIPKSLMVDAILARLDLSRSGKMADIRKRSANPGRKSQISRLRPKMRFGQLFQEWKLGTDPRPQTALEFDVAVRDFIDFAGDPLIALVDADLLYDYRDEAAKLPKSMPRCDRALPFRERVEKYAGVEPKTSPATLKKRLGGVQALLTYAFQQRWTSANAGSGVQIVGYTKNRRSRRSFEDHELQTLCASPLFTQPESWKKSSSRITDSTLFWLFLFAITSGARLEEVGQAAISDVMKDGDIAYLDITAAAPTEISSGKSVKTDGSIRLVPIHDELIRLGFLAYRDELEAAGHTQLFPDLIVNNVGKRTKEASQRANRIIDRYVAKDGRLVFHSLRHAFKAKGNDAGLNDRTLDQICGHAPVSTGGRYGSEPRVRTIHREMHQIDFSCIDWSAIAGKICGNRWKETVRHLPKV